jgi:hypothetical protein
VIFNTLNFYWQDVYTYSPYDIRDIDPYYLEFLEVLVNRLQAYPELLAYDFFNEPSIFETMYLTKQEVCELVKGWRNAVKNNAPYHLVTINSMWDDVFEWNMSNMKIDFISPHIYNDRSIDYEPDGTNQPNSLIRFKIMATWYQNNCPMPWVLGETGFSTSTSGNNSYPDVNGTEAQQVVYAQETLDIVRNYGGSGYSWWFVQETSWNDYEDGLGLLYHGAPIDAPANPAYEKPVVDVFRNYFDPGTNQPPAPVPPVGLPYWYYDPFKHANLNPTEINAVTGTILDSDGNPLKDALVIGSNYIGKLPDGNGVLQDVHSTIYTFTSDASSNNFKLIPFTPLAPSYTPAIVWLRISANGASRENDGSWGSVNPMPQPVTPFVLENTNFQYDVLIQNTLLTTSSDKTYFISWNDLTARDVEIENGVTSEWRARNSITLKDDFEAQFGSDVSVSISNAFPKCDDYSTFSRLSGDQVSFPSDPYSINNITLHFRITPESVSAKIKPNPNQGTFTIDTQGLENDETMMITIWNTLGDCVKKMSFTANESNIELKHLAKGLYFLKIQTENNTLVIKLMIN